jgi:hypothetical protein
MSHVKVPGTGPCPRQPPARGLSLEEGRMLAPAYVLLDTSRCLAPGPVRSGQEG